MASFAVFIFIETCLKVKSGFVPTSPTMGMIGTPMWMAPEQTEPGKSTPAADVWALGLILYFVTTGHRYWLAAENPEATITQLLKEVVMGPLPTASARARAQGAPAIARELDGVFARCVVRDPKQRYANAQLLWDALQSVLAPPSVRILTAAGGAPGGVTVAAGPLSAPLSVPKGDTAYVPLAVVPPVPLSGVNHGAGMSSPPLWKRLWPIPVAFVGLLFVQQCLQSARRSAAQKEAAQDERLSGFVVTPPAGGGGGGGGAARPANERSPACRLCTSGLTVTGALGRDAIKPVLDSAHPMFDQQCLAPRRGKRPAVGVATYAFTVREGRASNRRIERTSTNEGTEECLLRAFADLAFPSTAEETEVTVTVTFNAAIQVLR